MIQNEIAELIRIIEPVDILEKAHINESLEWIFSGTEIFRISKPDIPKKHLVSYFCLCDFKHGKILLVEHLKAGLWLPAGGHVEPGEHPNLTAQRECLEELGVEAKFWSERPIFITSTVTVGFTAGHTDVSLWYVLEGNCSEHLNFDQREFKSVRWFDFENIPYSKSDPNMKRFINKLRMML